ncbi:phage antirepressor KilAC domain-containing protein [Brochothrix thermosphacta]|uniref:phage antirepressor KilAC domain-containing protein n=1 Tax=Brochothrix thermosphacta TaxID=2756 RepID=UPI001C4FBB4E
MQTKKFKNNLFQLEVKTENGNALFDAETVARSLGFVEIKHGKEYVRWRTINGYLKKYLSQEVAKNDFISESMVYKLAFKANNSLAEKFQDWLASEVLPSIRKHGAYLTDEKAYDITHNPNSLADILQQASEQLRQKDLVIEEMKPKALFADAVSTSQTTILVGELAKLLKQNGVDIGATRLFKWLRDNQFLINRRGSDWNMPTQKSMNMKLFQIKETNIQHSDGHVSISKTAKVTGKGQQYFINKFLNMKLNEGGVG